MTTFDQREHAFEEKFAHDEELRFKVHAARNHMLGLWVAQKLGLSAAAGEAYASNLAQADVAKFRDDQVIQKVLTDFKAKGLNVSESDVRQEFNRLLPIVKKKIAGLP